MARFRAQEICDILKACKDAGVSKLLLGDIHVEFHPTMGSGVELVSAPAFQAVATQQEIASAQANVLAQNAKEIREQQLAEMIIHDPLGYERLLAQGELESAEKPDGE